MDNNDSDAVSILINNTYLLKYEIFRYHKYEIFRYHYNTTIYYYYNLNLTIEAFNINHNDTTRSLDIKYTEQMPYNVNSKEVFIILAERIKQKLTNIKNSVINILSEPLEHMPMYINDQDPYNKIAVWRLTLPKDHTQTRPLTTL